MGGILGFYGDMNVILGDAFLTKGKVIPHI